MAVKEGSDSDEHLSDDEMNKDEASAPVAEEGSSSPDLPTVMQVYEHNPGEVYPIAEEEEEAASPTTSDGVTSLRSRARLNSGYQPTTNTPFYYHIIIQPSALFMSWFWLLNHSSAALCVSFGVSLSPFACTGPACYVSLVPAAG